MGPHDTNLKNDQRLLGMILTKISRVWAWGLARPPRGFLHPPPPPSGAPPAVLWHNGAPGISDGKKDGKETTLADLMEWVNVRAQHRYGAPALCRWQDDGMIEQ